MHTYEMLSRQLKHMGIAPWETLLVHSSMKAIGDVEGRADTVLDVFMDYFGREGLLVLPTLTWSNVKAEQPVFSVKETPSVVGILPQLFRQRLGVIRSLHPTHSVAAWGPEAKAFTEGHERFDTPVPRFSPWHRLMLLNAKIMFLGCSMSHNTFLHGVEEWGNGVEVYSEQHQQLQIVDYDGKVIPRPMRRHTGAHSQFYGAMEPHFQRLGLLQTFMFGDAVCKVLDAAKAGRFVMGILAKYPAAFTEKWNKEHPDFLDTLEAKAE